MSGFWGPGPVLVAGPCVLEDDELNLLVARRLAELAEKLELRVVFKASFDKANRSRHQGSRGPGLERGLASLERVRDDTGVPVLTDVHQVGQVEAVAEKVDAIQIPAFLCRQTDLLLGVGATGKPVNVKKGQWADVVTMEGAVEKLVASGAVDVAVTERGTFFGYGDLVVDMRSFLRIRSATGATVLFDATHAVQKPGMGPSGSSGGDRSQVPGLLLAAAAAGADGFFVETHPTPREAPSDSECMWPTDRLPDLVGRALRVWRTARSE